MQTAPITYPSMLYSEPSSESSYSSRIEIFREELVTASFSPIAADIQDSVCAEELQNGEPTHPVALQNFNPKREIDKHIIYIKVQYKRKYRSHQATEPVVPQAGASAQIDLSLVCWAIGIL